MRMQVVNGFGEILTSSRATNPLVQNTSTGAYHQIGCVNNEDGQPTLFIYDSIVQREPVLLPNDDTGNYHEIRANTVEGVVGPYVVQSAIVG